jgi:negative regulator of sigma E activity
LKARVVNERGDVVEQFAFTDLNVNAKIDRALVEPSWPVTPPDWRVREGTGGDVKPQDTGWTVARVPPGFAKIMEGFRKVYGKPSRSRISSIPTAWSRSACSSSRCRRRSPTWGRRSRAGSTAFP